LKLNLFPRLIFAALLAFAVSTVIYFSFGNIYSSALFTYGEFKVQFDSGIYRYRILSGYFVLAVYGVLSDLNIDFEVFKLKLFAKNADPALYLSFYIVNTFFLMISAVVMILITLTESFAATHVEKILLVSVAVFTIALSQFVIVPYDVPGYFMQLLFFLLLIKYTAKPTTAQLLLLVIIVAVSTLNRESSALSIALAATVLYAKYGLKKESLVPVALLAAAFLAVYLGMRLFNDSFVTNDGNLLWQNFTQPKNILGLFLWILFLVFSLILAKDQTAAKYILLFHLFSAPYIIMCFYSGVLYEIRLYVPIFITSLFLGRTVITRHSIN